MGEQKRCWVILCLGTSVDRKEKEEEKENTKGIKGTKETEVEVQ